MRKLVTCEHCNGHKQCNVRSGKSCHDCLLAAGRRPKDWATVRCSYCGGMGRVWIEEAGEEAAAEQAAEEQAGTPAEE